MTSTYYHHHHRHHHHNYHHHYYYRQGIANFRTNSSLGFVSVYEAYRLVQFNLCNECTMTKGLIISMTGNCHPSLAYSLSLHLFFFFFFSYLADHSDVPRHCARCRRNHRHNCGRDSQETTAQPRGSDCRQGRGPPRRPSYIRARRSGAAVPVWPAGGSPSSLGDAPLPASPPAQALRRPSTPGLQQAHGAGGSRWDRPYRRIDRTRQGRYLPAG